jgi:hypothetical protein
MRIRTIALAGAACAAAALFATTAYADDLMMNTYANTVVTKDEATGLTSKLFFDKNHTYAADTTDKDGKPVHYTGTWMTKDDGKTLCLTPNAPPDAKEAPKPSCSALEKHNVGDSWKVTTDQKQTFDVSIVAGR